jgi:hypothetical protein
MTLDTRCSTRLTRHEPQPPICPLSEARNGNKSQKRIPLPPHQKILPLSRKYFDFSTKIPEQAAKIRVHAQVLASGAQRKERDETPALTPSQRAPAHPDPVCVFRMLRAALSQSVGTAPANKNGSESTVAGPRGSNFTSLMHNCFHLSPRTKVQVEYERRKGHESRL